MKKKNNIAIIATAVTLTSLIITAFYTQPTTSPLSPQIAPVSEVAEVDRTTTPLTETEPIGAEEITEIGTQTEEITEPITIETASPQPTEKEELSNTPAPPVQSSTNANETQSSTPSNGDTRIINGQQQGYLIGFGWVDNMGENTCTVVGDMYENGNKVGVIGDINKPVGSMG